MAGYTDPYGRTALGAQLRHRPLFLAIVATICLTGFYACSHRDVIRSHIAQRAPIDRTPIVGRAWIVDGDTIRIGGVSIRLEGIDAPEWDQPCTDADGRPWRCGLVASHRLRERARGLTFTCEPHARDRYGRVVAICTLPDGADVNAWLVREGLAVASGFSGIYRSEEADARAAKRGIWAGSFILPLQWRHQTSPRHRFDTPQP